MAVSATALKMRTAATRVARGDVPAEAAETGTVHRVVRVLAALAQANGAMRVSELAQQVGLTPSTTHRLLHLLKKEGVVQWSEHDHSYSVGPELLRISSRVVAATRITDIAQEFLDRLAQRFGETVVLGLYLPTHPAVSFVAHADGTHALQYRLPMHQPLSLLRGASGKSILAFLPKEIVSLAWTKERIGSSTAALPKRSVVAQALKRIHKDGYAVSEGERLPGAQGVAAPLFGSAGVLGCLCITAPKGRVSKQLVRTMVRDLLIEAGALSTILGAPETPVIGSDR